jgi:hypothetical protein
MAKKTMMMVKENDEENQASHDDNRHHLLLRDFLSLSFTLLISASKGLILIFLVSCL